MQVFTPADTSAANTLLAIIADPKAAKAALDDLVAAKAEHEAAAANAQAERAQARIESDAAEEKISLAVATIDRANRFTADEQRKLDARTAALSTIAEDLAASRRALDDDRKQHQERETAAYAVSAQWDTWKQGEEKRLAEVERELTARETAVAEAESKANALIADYTNRIAKLVATAKGEE